MFVTRSTTLAVHAVLAALAAFQPCPVAAEPTEPHSALRWECTQHYDAAFEVHCVPQSAAADTVLRSDPPPPAPARDMRPVAQRGDPEVFSTGAWLVPLHVAPRDESFVLQLLASVLCGKHPDCAVRYESRQARTALR